MISILLAALLSAAAANDQLELIHAKLTTQDARIHELVLENKQLRARVEQLEAGAPLPTIAAVEQSRRLQASVSPHTYVQFGPDGGAKVGRDEEGNVVIQPASGRGVVVQGHLISSGGMKNYASASTTPFSGVQFYRDFAALSQDSIIYRDVQGTNTADGLSPCHGDGTCIPWRGGDFYLDIKVPVVRQAGHMFSYHFQVRTTCTCSAHAHTH